MNPIQLKLKTAVIPVVLETPEGQMVEAELSEMSAANRDQYLEQLSSRMRVDSKGEVAGVKNFKGLQSALLVRCLKRKDGQEFSEVEIQGWPASAVATLFDEANKINHLTKPEEGGLEKNG